MVLVCPADHDPPPPQKKTLKKCSLYTNLYSTSSCICFAAYFKRLQIWSYRVASSFLHGKCEVRCWEGERIHGKKKKKPPITITSVSPLRSLAPLSPARLNFRTKSSILRDAAEAFFRWPFFINSFHKHIVSSQCTVGIFTMGLAGSFRHPESFACTRASAEAAAAAAAKARQYNV